MSSGALIFGVVIFIYVVYIYIKKYPLYCTLYKRIKQADGFRRLV